MTHDIYFRFPVVPEVDMRTFVAAFFIMLAPAVLHSQITRDNYYTYVPAMAKLVTETAASRALHLYGDAASWFYVDLDDNGIDDRRQAQLHRIADQFSPVLRRNNFSFPRNFKQVLGSHDILFVDTWAAGQLARSVATRLGWSADAPGTTQTVDTLLWSLLQDIDPLKTDVRFISAGDYDEKIMFVDFPGDGPKSWRAAYRDAAQQDATVYTHFFIHEDTAAYGDARFYLVAQNWFFYPFDDAANNHEGDWEHMNVLITTRDAAETEPRGRLTEAALRAVLDGEQPEVQSLVIAYVDYYFHENVYTLSYLPAYRRAETGAHTKRWVKRVTVWQEPEYVNDIVRARIAAGAGLLATHPIGFIGGDNKGPDELFSLWPRFGGAYNRNGHGTYAFPGTWQSVGAMASTEQLDGDAVPRLRAAVAATDDFRERMADPRFVTFAKENVILVPDWERVNALFGTRAQARRDWNWLVLPMRWGFPASKSPGGGALAHADVGNISPEGPAFQPTWNRVGTAAGWRGYEPEILRVMLAPVTPWDKLKSGWGLLNVPVALLGFLPGWNVAVTQLMPWVSGTLHVFGAPPPRTFRPVNVNARFSSISVGVTRQFGGNDFALMLPADTSHDASVSALTQSATTAVRYGMQLYYGRRLSVENTFAQSQHTVGADYANQNGLVSSNVRGALRTRDLTGGIRYDVARPATDDLLLFLRAGWGWTWYTLDEVSRNEEANDVVKKGGYPPTILPTRRWWPNSWYAGAGVEYFAPRKAWLLPQFGYGVRTEVTNSRHRLDATNPGERNLGIVGRYEVGLAAVFSW